MNFYRIESRQLKSNNRSCDWEVWPDFKYGIRNSDLITKGGEMFAYWYDGKWHAKDRDPELTISDLIDIIDREVSEKVKQLEAKYPDMEIRGRYMSSNGSGIMKTFLEYARQNPQSKTQFNKKILFADHEMKKSDYATTQLSYTPMSGPTPAFDEMFELLYAPKELEKILWFMGASLTNSMQGIQKFLYLYGGKGTGKGTILKVFKSMFQQYVGSIDLAHLTSEDSFATSEIKEVPILIDEDTDLSNIKKDINLLKLTAHEELSINAKYKQTYPITFNGLLITASNQRYKVRNIDSGITRRAVVAEPTSKTHTAAKYKSLMKQIEFEIPMIAQKAIDVFENLGPDHFENYVDYSMVEATDIFYTFVKDNYLQLGDPCPLSRAAELYRVYLEDMKYGLEGYKKKVKQELKRYYAKEYPQRRIGDQNCRNVYEGFRWDLVFPETNGVDNVKEVVTVNALLADLNICKQKSLFDEVAADYPAQYATDEGLPKAKWDNVKTILRQLDTSLLHYVRMPLNHIILDFDIKVDGKKNLLKNLQQVLNFPPTYTELSKSGEGVHLHYFYDGDVSQLANLIDTDMEIKVYSGKSSLRRKLAMCNDLPIAHISSGLPLKEERPAVYKDIEVIKLNEQKMRALVKGNLEKKYHANTRPSVDFIVKIFEDAQKAGVAYDLRDMRQDILTFASRSTNQASECIKSVSKINFSTIEIEDSPKYQKPNKIVEKEELTFYDVEVYPNLFVLVTKQYGKKPKAYVNPTAEEVDKIVKESILVGYNNRRYDNHIMYARMLNEDNMSLYRQSQRIITKKDGGNGFYGGAYELSYTDIYDYCNAGNKKSLKKWEVELGIHHDEIEFPWDQPVAEENWPRVVEYCTNDVIATEKVFDATQSDYKARQILSAISGLSMNATTNQHTTQIVFEGNKNTEQDLVYTDLSDTFPGYKYEFGVSTYRGEVVGEGGEVYAEPGVYYDVGLDDIASMHPFSAIALNAFGKYTKNFIDLVNARIYIKHGEYELAAKLFNGKLKPFLKNPELAKELSLALKTAINSAYGLTSASFPNAFKHPKNVDNIVAKRGALFMIDLRHAVQAQGYQVVHVKTDSIKIANVDDKIIKFVHDFGKKYGYTFEHEATYEKLVLINETAYAALDVDGKWHATAKPFIIPYVFKRLFTKEPIVKEDLFEIKEVKDAAIYLDDRFVGKFAEVYCSKHGQPMYRVTPNKKGALNGTKGRLWKLSSEYGGKDDVDFLYYESMVDDTLSAISKVGSLDILPELMDQKNIEINYDL